MTARSIPNILTVSRLLACPVFLILAAQDIRALRWIAWVLLVVALVTDVVDGILARKYGWVSKLGVYLDPAVDKVVLLTGFYQVSSWGWTPLWVPMALMVRDLIIEAMRSGAAMEGRLVPANWMGKTKAFMMSLTLGTAYCAWAWFYPEQWAYHFWSTVVLWMSYVTTAASVIFGIRFLYLQRQVFFEKAPRRQV